MVASFPEIVVQRQCSPEDASTLIGSTVPEKTPSFYGPMVARDKENSSLVAAHLPIASARALRKTVLQIPVGVVARTHRYSSRSQTFGYAPRRPVIGREGCAQSAVMRDFPVHQKVLDHVADECAALLEQLDHEAVQQDRETTKKVLPEWKLGESKLWTSGVINHTAQLPYHRDNFNFPAYSAMPCIRRGITGGYLHLPEYGLVIPCQDGYASFFKGQELVHGVTPFKRKPGKLATTGYRYTVVFYALKGMKDCYTAAVESKYARSRRTKRERDMAKRLAAGDTTIPGMKLPISEAESCAEAADIASASSGGGVDDMTLDYHVAVPSYKRASTVAKYTLPYLTGSGIDPKSIILFIRDNDPMLNEYSLVSHKFGCGLAPANVRGIRQCREVISCAFPEGSPVVQADDDIKRLAEARQTASGKNTIHTMTNVDTFIRDMFTTTYQHGYHVWGVCPVPNPVFLNPGKIAVGLRFIIGTFFGHTSRPGHPIHTATVESKEDYELSLKAWKYDGAVVRNSAVAVEADHYKLPGGCVDSRTLQREIHAAATLQQAWPNEVRINKKRGNGGEITLRTLKARGQ